MSCLHPISVRIKGSKYTIQVPCGKCPLCLENKRNQWAFRLKNEFNNSTYSRFVTLTYDDVFLPILQDVETLYKPDLKYFIKNLQTVWQSMWAASYRKTFHDKYVDLRSKEKEVFDLTGSRPRLVRKWIKNNAFVRFYATGEYGDKFQRPHYHLLLFFNVSVGYNRHFDLYQLDNLIKSCWDFGLIDVGNVTDKSINYCAKHEFKVCNSDDPKCANIFSIMSRNPGLGYRYLDNAENVAFHLSDPLAHSYVVNGRFKVSLPSFYKRKLFSVKKTDQELYELREKQFETMCNCYRTVKAKYKLRYGSAFDEKLFNEKYFSNIEKYNDFTKNKYEFYKSLKNE